MSKHKIFSFILLTLPVLTLAGDVSHGSVPHLDGENLAIFWVVPFAGILLSIAVFPLLAPHF